MPVTPQVSYPGVYIQEVPSGVRTIAGVSTSIAAFVGRAKRGSINKAKRINNFGDYERLYGGLDKNCEMSYAVKMFFDNGGSEAWIVRLAKNATTAEENLVNGDNDDILNIKSEEMGKIGNYIELRINYNTDNPFSTFNLTVIRTVENDPQAYALEEFENLSMNSNDLRYVEDVVNKESKLIRVDRIADITVIDGDDGYLESGSLLDSNGSLTDVSTLIDATHNQLRISANGSNPVDVSLPDQFAGADEAARLGSLCDFIKDVVNTADTGDTALTGFACAPNSDNNRIVMTSGESGENSYVRILPGLRNDASVRLKLDINQGMKCVDAVAALRPKEIPDSGYLVSGGLVAANVNNLPADGKRKFQISLDGIGPDIVDIGNVAATGTAKEKLINIAERIQGKVRELPRNSIAYKNFTCKLEKQTSPYTIKLSSGSRGEGSKVLISEFEGDTIAATLKLFAGLEGAVSETASNVTLEGGNENNDIGQDYSTFIGTPVNRQGIFALETVDLFNILCLPGIHNPGILADAVAYCQDRRAFFIIDAPQNTKTPREMELLFSGPELPKSEFAAIYYPWIQILDPLTGRKKITSPCGAVAGTYAKTDNGRGVWKAPAGIETNLLGVNGLDYTLTDEEQGVLNKLGVNCIRQFPVISSVIWGARTLRGADQLTSEYKYIPVRRLALFMEESLYRGLKWVVFEPNDEPLWAQIRLNVGAFMHNLFRQGAFQGQKPSDAYFVKCDKETTIQTHVNLGIVNIWVGFAPLKPAEFVILYLQQMAGQIEV